MTIYLTKDGKTHMMKDGVLTELAVKGVVYAELNGMNPYFVTYNRDLVDKDGNAIEVFGSNFKWVKEVKGDVVLTERMRVYDLSKVM